MLFLTDKMSMSIKYLYSANNRRSNLRRWLQLMG